MFTLRPKTRGRGSTDFLVALGLATRPYLLFPHIRVRMQ